MKRYFIILLVLIPVFGICSLFGAEGTDVSELLDHSSATFEILGYKVNPEADLAFEITDALSESLAVIGSDVVPASGTAPVKYSNISLDNHMDQLLGDVDAAASDPRNQIIFSYRVTGRGNEQSSNTYHVDFCFRPFFRYENDQQDTESYINASYQLVNRSYSFPDYTSDRNQAETEIIENANGTSTLIVRDTQTSNVTIYKDGPTFAGTRTGQNEKDQSVYEINIINEDGESTYLADGLTQLFCLGKNKILYVSDGDLYFYNGKERKHLAENVDYVWYTGELQEIQNSKSYL